MKRYISLFIALLCLLICLCGCSFAYEYSNGKTVDNVYYVFNKFNKTCFAAQYQWDGKSTDIVIQDEVDGHKVTELGGYTGRGVPTPFAIYYQNNIFNETSAESDTFVMYESKLPETVVVHYKNFNIKIGKYVNSIKVTANFSGYQKIDSYNYIKTLLTFSVSSENKYFQVNNLGMINYVKEGYEKTNGFDYAATHNLDSYDMSKFYKLVRQGDLAFKYFVFDADGEMLDSEISAKEPYFKAIGKYLMQLSVQTGTGISTNYAKYYDLKNSKTSETFNYVLTAKDNYVVCADYRNGKHIIIVQDIFDKEKYYKEYELENVSPVAADFAVEGHFNEKGNINITYLSGENYKETNYTIVLSLK